MIKLFVGLGNPGVEYEATRHNAGFWWVDGLARDLGLHLSSDRAYHGLVARGSVGGRNVWLLEPQTYMNVSGKSVAALARFFKIAPEATVATTACATSTRSWAPATTGGFASASAIRA